MEDAAFDHDDDPETAKERVCWPGKNECFGTQTAEIWDPETKLWSPCPEAVPATEDSPRMYHGNAILLRDATVLSTGGGKSGPLVDQASAQVFVPPYGAGVAPQISLGAQTTSYGSDVLLELGNAAQTSIARVTLLRLGSATHGFNMEQRFIDLTPTMVPIGTDVLVTLPTSSNEVPPGWYLVFALDPTGNPSQGEYLQITDETTVSWICGPGSGLTVREYGCLPSAGPTCGGASSWVSVPLPSLGGTQTGWRVHTPPGMIANPSSPTSAEISPEQITGAPVDGRTDLYSVGVLLYRMLTGSLPFASTDLRKLMQMHISAAVPPLPERVPRPLREFVATLLAKDRNHRQVSAGAARDELDAIIGGAAPVGLPTRCAGDEPPSAFETLDVGAALGGRRKSSSTRGRVAIRASAIEGERPVVARAEVRTVTPGKSRLRWVGWGAAVSIAVAAILLTEPGVYDRLVAPREAVVAGDGASAEQIGGRDAVDLRTASASDEPCIAFAAALARMDRAGDPRDLVLLDEVEVPSARARDDATTRAVCEQLPRLVLGVRTRLAKLADPRR